MTGTVVPSVLDGAVAQAARPVVVFVAGQPGSGKTLVVDLVHAALGRRGGAVRVDRDAYKAAHPSYAAYLAEDVRTAGVRVRPETYRWQAEVEARVREGRYDAVVEAPLAHPEEFLAGMAAYRRAGYRVEFVALAVPEAVSQLGILDRYLRLAQEGRARYVSWDNHDNCAASLVPTLTTVEAARLADRVVVVTRSAEAALRAVYDNELGPAGWVRPAGAADAVLAERQRPWGPAETGQFRRQLADTDRRLTDPRLPEDWSLAVRRDAERAAACAEPVRRTAQPRRDAPGVDYHRLSAEEHRWIFDALIVPLLGPITPQEKPVAVYVLGQPGAGKTRAAQMVRRALRGCPAHITGDDFKASHPDYLQLLREEPRTASARIRADYRAWQAQAEAHVRQQRADVVIEITPASAPGFIASASLYRRAGYRVELVVLAVRAADSRQGTAARYATVSQRGVPARFTTAAGHDGCYSALPEVVAAAEQLAAVDELVVMRRDAHPLYRNTLSGQGRWARRPAAALALAAEQTRPYTLQEAGQFWSLQRWLHRAMPQYRDDLIATAGLACPLMPAQQPRQLPTPPPAAALPLPV
ncbi:zeta toxin family protein [Streptomyces ramulosus]|uniref:zeta toxin family protein n=1 Tax=Streptomyces TaxID=1883 RepID=UPI0031E677E7